MTSRVVFALLLLGRLSAASSSALCYTPDGLSDSSQWPCGDTLRGGFSVCCDDGWACLSDGLCGNPTDNTTYRRGTCTDSTWTSSVCPRVCLSQSRFGPVELELCGNDTANASFCCASDTKCNCRTKTNVVRLADPTISTITTAGFGATPGPNTDTAFDTFTRYTTATDSYPYPTYDSPSPNGYGDHASRPYYTVPIIAIIFIVVIVFAILGGCLACGAWYYSRRRGIALRRAEAAWVASGGRTVAAFRPPGNAAATVPVIATAPVGAAAAAGPPMAETRGAPADTAAVPAPGTATAGASADPDVISPAPSTVHALTNDRAVVHSGLDTPSAPSAVSVSPVGTYATPVIPSAHPAATGSDQHAAASVSPAT